MGFNNISFETGMAFGIMVIPPCEKAPLLNTDEVMIDKQSQAICYDLFPELKSELSVPFPRLGLSWVLGNSQHTFSILDLWILPYIPLVVSSPFSVC
jgi:hypothetical protein